MDCFVYTNRTIEFVATLTHEDIKQALIDYAIRKFEPVADLGSLAAPILNEELVARGSNTVRVERENGAMGVGVKYSAKLSFLCPLDP